MIQCCFTSILLALHCAQASLLWTIDQKITHYGETLTLLCHVPNCCPKYAGWDIVDQNGIDHTLFTDIKGHKKKASAKYDGEVKTNGYTLIIRNLTKQDLNFSYKCVYHTTIGDPLMLLEKDVFKASLLWTVGQKITKYGDTLTLLCHVPHCCPKYAGWDIVDGDGINHPLFTDIKSHIKKASAKYDGEVKSNGYTLIIRNLTQQDLNVSYACVYGSTIGGPLILSEKDLFKDGTYRNESQHLQSTSLVPFVPHRDAVERTTSSSTMLLSVYPQRNDESDNTAMIIIVSVLGVALLVLLIVTLCIWRTTEHFMCQFNMCFNHGHYDPIVPPPEEIPLNQVGNGDVQEEVDNRTTEGGRPTATPTDNGNSEIYRDQATSNLYQTNNSNTSTSEQCHNNNSVSRSSKSPHVECVTGKCTTDQSLASGRYITMNA